MVTVNKSTPVVIPAVQHTGSRLIASMFAGDLSLPKPTGYIRKDPGVESTGGSLFYAHPNIYNIGDFSVLASKFPTIVPMRHPLRSAFSWQNQGKDLEDWKVEWDLVINNIDQHDPEYLCVDLKDRVKRLHEINTRFGLNLQSMWLYYGDNSWPAVRDDHTTPAIPKIEDITLSDSNIEIAADFIKKNSRFFGRFYNDC